MKSLFLSTTICLFFIPLTQAQEIEEAGYIEISTDRIKNTNIKSIKEESDCYVEQEKPPYKFEDCGEKTKEEYDKNGHLTSLKLYEDGDLTDTYTYLYEENKLVSEKEDDGEDTTKKTYRYNTSGLLIEKKEYDNNTLEYLYTYAYNKKGFMIEKEYTSLREDSGAFGGTTYSKTIYTYNNNGKCTSETEYHKDGREKNKIIYEHSNTNGHTILEKEKHDEDKYVPQYSITYDTRGNITEKILYSYYGKQEERRVRTFDANNNVLTYESYNEDNVLVNHIVYNYNAQKDPIQEVSTRNKDDQYIRKYMYEYDERGNWITRVTLKDGDEYISNEVKRTIKYY
ncbi:hypothetical protein [uncultured Dokdonia sp.]|uniref:hypothetical protein n=1 Tax=uncultured Dokdonia sp. TaxID=575653 RepID=UPI0026034C30|nr:hypothetical protein [uncultured Dokdonia sp.]